MSDSKNAKRPSPLRLVVGGYYRRRDGQVVGPAVFRNSDDDMPWMLDHYWYDENGTAPGGGDSVDLIARVPKPRAKSPKSKPRGRVVWLVEDDGDSGYWFGKRSYVRQCQHRDKGRIHRIELPARKERG